MNTKNNNQELINNDISLDKFINFLYKNYISVAIFTILGLFVSTTLVTLAIPKKYETMLTVKIPTIFLFNNNDKSFLLLDPLLLKKNISDNYCQERKNLIFNIKNDLVEIKIEDESKENLIKCSNSIEDFINDFIEKNKIKYENIMKTRIDFLNKEIKNEINLLEKYKTNIEYFNLVKIEKLRILNNEIKDLESIIFINKNIDNYFINTELNEINLNKLKIKIIILGIFIGFIISVLYNLCKNIYIFNRN